jgi:uncharacterized protein YbjT (DUF2867 family)
MSHHYKTATVFGGTGFVGRQVVRGLARMGVTVKVASRVPERAYFLRPCGKVGQVVPFACNYNDTGSIAESVRGSDYVVNCVGVLHEKGKKQTFEKIHIDLPANIARACQMEGVEKFVHVSALGCDKSFSRYGKTKFEGEKAVLKNFPQATILRPSVIFGEGDSFFNRFAHMAQFLPALPLIGGGQTKFQPVYVGDVADAALNALNFSEAAGQIYELGGPDVVNFQEIYEILFRHINKVRWLVTLPFSLAKTQAFFMGVLPNPPLTRDQVESLKTDSVVAPGMPGLENLGVRPTSMDLILPHYLERYRPGGRFSDKKYA